MNVTSLELSKELYELSGWEKYGEAELDWWYQNPNTDWALVDGDFEGVTCPAYDLGFLLRKLPSPTIKQYSDKSENAGLWLAFIPSSFHIASQRGDTPEDAACRLAIELFKSKTLTREEADHE